MTDLQRLDQHLAERARQIVGNKPSEPWRTRLRQLPAQLRGGGLPATYADLMAQGNKGDGGLPTAYQELTKKIAEHVDGLRLLPTMKSAEPIEFLDALSTADLSRYTRVCAEVDALAVWMSRLVEATNDG